MESSETLRDAEREALLHESERARAEAEEARARVTRTLESISDAFYAVDAGFHFTYVNRKAEALWGRRREELIGRHYWTEFPGAVGSESHRMHLEVMAARRAVHYETVSPLIARWIEVSLYPEEGGGLVCYFRDISERKAAEAERECLLGALELERSRLARVFAQTPSILAVVRGPNHVLELANEGYLRLIGHRDVIGKPLLDAVTELRGQGFEQLLDEVIATGTPYVGREVPIGVAPAEGAPAEVRYFDFVYLPMVEPDGTRSGVIAHGIDVTGQVHARREVERARDRAHRLQALTAALAATRTPLEVAEVVVAQGVTATEAETGMLALRTSPPTDDRPGEGAVLRHHGLSAAVVEQYSRFPLTKPGPIAECLRTGEVTFIEDGAALRARFPETAHLFDAMGTQAVAAVPLAVADEVVGAMSFSWTTPRVLAHEDREMFLAFGRQAAQALERARLFEAEHVARADAEAARVAAEAASRAKSEFLAVMSHELRTPLNAIGGYAQLLEMGIRGAITEAQRGDLNRIQASQRHLLGLINEVLNYARLEAGAVRYDLSSVRVRDALAGAEGLVAPQASAKGLTLAIGDCPPDLHAHADPEKLRQVLVNLLSNAVKFTSGGGRIELESAASGRNVEIRVRDTGIGIAREQIERIFEPFVQVRAELTRTAEGTGLGLAISRDLARGMGGDISVQSRLGEGSVFTLTLPAA